MIRTALRVAATVLTLSLGIVPAIAGPKPAVSQHNAKVDIFGGSISGITGYGVQGAFAFPLGSSFGAQIDGLVGAADGYIFRGIGGHVFWRDPSRFLIGAFGSYVDWEIGATVRKLGGEVEWYHGPLTFEGMLAAQSGDFTGLAARAAVALYVHENIRLDAAYRRLEGIGSIGAVGVEWQHGKSGLALFANGSWGQGGAYQTVIGGVRFYAGQSKSLVERHREEDPPVPEVWDLFSGKFDTC